MSIDEELTTEDVDNYILSNESRRIFVRIPVAGSGDFSFAKIIGFLKTIEESVQELDVIIYAHNGMVHSRAVTNENMNSKTAVTEKLLNRLHLDYLPYSEIIASVPQNDRNEEILRSACTRYGVVR